MKVIVWNLETFGTYNFPHRNRVVCDFVAHVVAAKEADVLIVQELTREGESDLAMLQVYLREATACSWDYDYLPGAIRAGTADAAPVAFGDLAYTATAHNEGYAVLYKIDPHTEIPALQPLPPPGMSYNSSRGRPSYISLVTHGAQLTQDTGFAMPFMPVAPYVRTPLPFAIPNPAPVLDPDATRHHNQSGHDGAVSYCDVRRPCRVVLDAANTPVDLVVYHAPVSGNGAYYGTGICGLIEQVQDQAGFPDVIVAGDFNNITPGNLRNAFENLTLEGLEYGTGDPTRGFERSMPRFTVNNWGAVLLPSGGDQASFYGNPRDQLLYRFTSPHRAYNSSEVIDIMTLLLTNDSLQRYVNTSNDIRGFIASNINNLPPVVTADANLMAAIQQICDPANQTPFNNHQTAAVFYKLFITDHFPVFIDFD